ncbi:uncharacterized protein L969DRAFT_87998 [Mixia osmundae IAM 14324]|uniref:uncharacterized protein n=1 Tax=Mixia osmundae (strain CBS 9802 / IAM 14324 / JCM 22182 / KY 12970) TaxID=764103 RepID=UPI0004A54C8D|nr:uncharacterized protein L969DRAFT_87998 [Mixia osmundae IAM 14324]KEI38732.1 hypothetical protein L969DRAFT_87998 [Mixia osmundae IAM 14324]
MKGFILAYGCIAIIVPARTEIIRGQCHPKNEAFTFTRSMVSTPVMRVAASQLTDAAGELRPADEWAKCAWRGHWCIARGLYSFVTADEAGKLPLMTTVGRRVFCQRSAVCGSKNILP